MQSLLWDTPWCIPRIQRTGSWSQALCWAVLSSWRSPAEALYAPLWVDPQGWAQPDNLKHKAPPNPRLATVDYGKNAPAEVSREGLWRTPMSKCASSWRRPLFSRIASRWREWWNPPGCNQYFRRYYSVLTASVRFSKPLSPPATIQMSSRVMQGGNPAFPSSDLARAGS